jgi:hypothetical protein
MDRERDALVRELDVRPTAELLMELQTPPLCAGNRRFAGRGTEAERRSVVSDVADQGDPAQATG